MKPHSAKWSRGAPAARSAEINAAGAPRLHRFLRRSTALFLLVLAAGAPLAGSPVVLSPDTLLADPAGDPAWRDLFGRLSPDKNRVASFAERRTFPFRKTPVTLTGEIRLSAEHGLSLTYLGEKPHTIVVDREGVLLRDARGRTRTAPSDRRADTATSALFDILRFDLPALARDFVIHGLRDGDAWALGFVPRDSGNAELLGSIVVHGEGPRLERIAMIKSDTQRIDIEIGETRDDVVFSAEELRRYFR